ncbi:MAG: hypothetical protein JWN48_109 [Myxococcaceae bacterium]|nr:hypothetical protein [Myxococcaceae bacterium]
MPQAGTRARKVVKAKSRAKPAGLVATARSVAKRVAKIDKRARFSEELKARAVAMAREGKVTREIGTELGLDKAQWQNIRLWTEKANVDLPKERKRTPRKSSVASKPVSLAVSRKVRAASAATSGTDTSDPIARILELIENPAEAVATLEAERGKVMQRLSTIDKLLAVLRSGE